jgi:hypothetical protein
MNDFERAVRRLRRDGWSFYQIGKQLRKPWQTCWAAHRRLVEREEAELLARIREGEAK